MIPKQFCFALSRRVMQLLHSLANELRGGTPPLFRLSSKTSGTSFERERENVDQFFRVKTCIAVQSPNYDVFCSSVPCSSNEIIQLVSLQDLMEEIRLSCLVERRSRFHRVQHCLIAGFPRAITVSGGCYAATAVGHS